MTERTAALLDEQYLLYGARALGGRFDYRAALDWICARFHLVRAVVFALAPNPGSGKKWFLRKLGALGYDVQTRQPKVFRSAISHAMTCPECGHVSRWTQDRRDGDMDIYIAMEAVRLAHAREVDHLLLVSADLHFVPLISQLWELYGVSTSVMAFSHNTHEELRRVARAFHAIGPELVTPVGTHPVHARPIRAIPGAQRAG